MSSDSENGEELLRPSGSSENIMDSGEEGGDEGGRDVASRKGDEEAGRRYWSSSCLVGMWCSRSKGDEGGSAMLWALSLTTFGG